jgi:hypothetical protein
VPNSRATALSIARRAGTFRAITAVSLDSAPISALTMSNVTRG